LDRKVIKYLLNKKDKGFSLIELLLIFVLIIGMTTTVLKQIKKKVPTVHDLMIQINEVTQDIFLKSILDGLTYQVHLFFSDNNTVTHIGYTTYNRKTNKTEPLLNKKKLARPFIIYNCFINGHDEMAIKAKEIWFNFYPEGHCQEVKFIMSAEKSDIKHTYILNPFNGRIED
jgi:hypothetical protein